MGREIKFRGISIESGEWVYGFYSQKKPFTEVRHYIQKGLTNEWVEVFSASVGQYTGVSDYDKYWIYEGDILKDKGNEHYKVEHRFGAFVRAHTSGREYPLISSIGFGEMRVIGNIYETPELINSLPKQ